MNYKTLRTQLSLKRKRAESLTGLMASHHISVKMETGISVARTLANRHEANRAQKAIKAIKVLTVPLAQRVTREMHSLILILQRNNWLR